ncbi:MAG: hypothetical protein OXI26_11490 [bacterium]|nr:hypothetical protein [bacterium]
MGTPLLVSPLSSTSEGYDGRTGSLALDFGTTGVDREYVVVANTAGVAANAAAPALEAWRDVDVDGMVDDDTIQLCSHDPPLGTPGQRLGVDGYAYAYGPYSLAGTLVGDDSFVSVRTRPIVAVSAGRSTVTEGDGAAFTLTRVAATDAGPSTAALTVRLSVSETGTMIAGAAPVSVTIPEGATEVSFTVATIDDSVDEDDSDITVRIDSAIGYSVFIREATVTVADDDLPLVAVGAAGSPIGEGDTAFFAVSRVGSTTSALTVDLTVAESGGDMVASADEGSRSVTISAGDSSVSFGVATVDDSVVEADSTITVSVTGGADYGVVLPGSASVVVADDDSAPPVPVFLRSRSSLPATEGTSLVFEVSRGFGGSVTEPLTVNVRVSELGDVVAAGDVGLRSVVIAAGDRRATFSVATVDDSVAEGHSVVAVEVAGGAGYSFSPFFASESVAVYDNDGAPPRVAIWPLRPFVATDEGAALDLVVVHTGASTSPMSVELDVSESGDTLDPGTAGSRSFTIPAGANSARFRVFTLNDDVDEGLSTVTVGVASGTGYSIGSPGSVSFIVAGNDVPRVRVDPVASPVSEGAAAGFTVSHRYRSSAQPTTVELRVSETGDMISATPFASVTIPAGATSTTFEVPTVADGDAEVDSVVTVVIVGVDDGGYSPPVHASSPGVSASVTVHDTENIAPRVTIAPPAFADYEGAPATFTLGRSGATTSALTVALAVTETGEAISGAAPTSVTIPAGATSVTVEVPTDDDDLDEDDSVITVAIAGGAGYVIGTPGSASIPVQDDDRSGLAEVTIERGTSDTVEGGAVYFTVSRVGPRGSPLSVALRVTETGEVISGTAPTSVTIPAGATRATFEVPTDDDAAEENDNTISVAIVSGAGYVIATPGSAHVPVYDNDAPPTITIQADFASTEADPARFIVRRAGSPTAALTVALTITETGDMINPDNEGSTSVTIPAGAISTTLEVPTDDDDVDEDDSTITATISPGTGYDLGAPTSASVTVYDNDVPTVTIRPQRSGVIEGYATQFILSRTDPTTSPLTIELTVAETGDMVDSGDEGSRPVTFGARQASVTFDLNTVDDTVAEDDSTITVTIATSTLYTTGTPASATVTARDDDGTPTVTIRSAPFRVYEGTAAGITVHRSGPTTSPLTIEITVTETGDMIDPSHEGAISFTIPAEQISATFELPTVDDTTDEDDSTVTAIISNGGGLTIGSRNPERFTIIDNDLPTVTVQPGASPVTEGAPARFTFHRTGPTTAALTVDLSVTETGDMISADDEGPRSLTIPAGKTSATFEVATLDDTLAEDGTTITATISRRSRYTIGMPSSASVAATDNDLPTVTIQPGTSPVTEGDTTGFTISRTGPTTGALTVKLSVTETGDMIGADDEGARSFTIAAGETSGTFEVATLDDTLAEDDSIITVSISTSTDYVTGTPGSATVTSNDNDQ